MHQGLRVAILASTITAALVYVVLEWSPFESAPAPDSATDQADATDRIETWDATEIAYSAPATPQGPVQSASLDLTPDEENNVEIYRRYSPGVVNITTTSYSFDFFLRPIPESGTGSGVVVDDDGHIVTNYHVIESARRASIEVTLWDQSRHPATVVGADPYNDLAVLQVDAPDVDWVPIPFGTTNDLQVGQKVLAIGNPFGLERTLTTGIISSLSRSIRATADIVIEGVIQTDAAINSGNSGGPLLNRRGEVIGINTAIITGSTGIGFAIPVETVRRVARDLIDYGRVRRVTMGVQAGYGVNELGQLAEFLDLGVESGVLVVNVARNSPAERAGLRGADRTVNIGNRRIPAGGDVIVAIDGRPVNSTTEIRTILEPLQPGDEIEISIVRNRQRLDLDLTLEEGAD